MKTLIASALILASSSVFAHDNSFSHDSCNVELNGGIKINQTMVQFLTDKKPVYKIVNDQDLYVGGQQIDLTASQQSLVTDYSTSIRQILPEVEEIALDAIELATDGVNLAFDELLGEGNDIGSEITLQLSEVRQEVERAFSEDQEIYFDENGLEGEGVFGEEFEARIESAVEETIQNSMGSLLIAVGQEVLFSGDGVDGFEARMENFGEQIEHEMEARGEAMEKRADALCSSVVAIDALEENLSTSIEELENIDFITTSQSDNSSI
jgi:hypothetical protein